MDTALVNRNAVTAPKNYQVPGAQEFILRAVSASIDGSATTGAWQPALQLISPAGDVMWTAVNQQVAAGASASVSWFPGVSKFVPNVSVATIATVALIKDGGTIPNNAYTTLPYDSVLSEHDPNGVFSVNLGTGVITTNVTCVFSLDTYIGFTATGSNNIRVLLNGTAGSFGKAEDSFASNSDLSCSGSLNSGATQTFAALIYQNSGAAATILHARSTITMLAPTP